MRAFIPAAILLLSSCAYPVYMTDQPVRQRIFKECLAEMPAPDANAVKECDDAARRQALVCVEDCPYTDYVSQEDRR